MSTTETITLVTAGLALFIGLVAAVAMWRMQVSQARSARLRHPSAAPLPVSVSLDDDGHAPHWRVDLRADIPSTTIDILSYRPSDGGGQWESEPLLEPLWLEPGGWALMPSEISGEAVSFDVVVAWTVRTASGDVQGSRTIKIFRDHRVEHRAHSSATSPMSGRWSAVLVPALFVVALALTGLFAWRLAPYGPNEATPTPPTSDDGLLNGTATGIAVDPRRSDQPPATTSTTILVASAAPIPTMSSGSDRTTTSESPITSTPGIESESPTAPAPETATLPLPQAGRIEITGRVEDCRFGFSCVIASFSVAGFDSTSGTYVCEFADGSRATFRFGGSGAQDACAASGIAPSITIEIDGIRSETITRDSLTE